MAAPLYKIEQHLYYSRIFICHSYLRAPGYLRYVDDFALFHDDPAVLADWRERIVAFLVGRRLLLHPRKTFIAPTAQPALFLGYELHPGGLRRLPAANVDRFRGRLRGLRDRWRAGSVEWPEVEQKITAWIAHAAFADTFRLRHALFRGGVFDPALKPSRMPAAGGFCAAVRGTTIQGTSAPPTVTGTTRTTATTTSVSVSPVRAHARTAMFKDTAGVRGCVHIRL